MNFEEAVEKALAHEGEYVNDPNDPGGETKWGISKRSYPHLDVSNLSREAAIHLYRRDFWEKARCGTLPDLLRFPVFDFAINSGPVAAITTLQRTVGTAPDGILGPHTLAAIMAQPLPRLVIAFHLQRMLFQAKLVNFKHHGAGWTRRNVANIYQVLPLVK